MNRAQMQDASTTTRSNGSRAVTSYFLAVAAITIVILLASLIVAAVLSQRARQARWQEAAGQSAQLISHHLAEEVATLQQALAQAADLEALQDALRERDPLALSKLAQVLQSAFPLAARLLLVPEGSLSANPNASPPIGYALLDMVKTASAGHRPPVEIHLPGRSGANVNLVEPVRAAEQTLGTLVLTIPADRWLRFLTPSSGAWASLQRHTAGTSVTLLEAGDRNASGQRVQIPVPGTAWQLEYISAHGAETLAGLQAPIVLAVIAAAMLLIVLTALAAGIRLRQALGADARTLARLVHDCLGGEPRARYPLRLRELQAALPPATSAAGGAPVSTPRADTPPEASPKTASRPRTRTAAGLPAQRMEVAEIEAPSPATTPDPGAAPAVDSSILRAYDIRGRVGKTLTSETVHWLGLAIGSEAAARGQQSIIVGYDGRHSSEELAAALCAGLAAAGRDVIDIGRVPTPLVYFATYHFASHGGVAVTGSHNPPEYNGLKIMLGDETLYGEDIQALGRRIESGDLTTGDGSIERRDIQAAYRERVLQDVALHRPFKVVVDCGNGVAGAIAPDLLQALGCEVVALFCDVDGDFPNHHPDPTTPENLQTLIEHVRAEHAELGLAFDGDGDRLGVVDNQGKIIWPDRQLMLFAEDILSRNPGSDIVFDVKCSNRLADVITEAAGVPVLWKSGHSLIKSKLRETGAPLGGEMSGHIFFNERWYGFDDGIYAAARLLEILSMDPRESAEVFAQLPEAESTPELRLSLEEGEPERVIAALLEQASFSDARVTTIDGLRVDFPDGWGLVRASNTEPCLVWRFEGDDAVALRRIETLFRELIERVRPGLELPF